jgi:hypothetical protein
VATWVPDVFQLFGENYSYKISKFTVIKANTFMDFTEMKEAICTNFNANNSTTTEARKNLAQTLNH